MLVAIDGKAAGLIGVADPIKESTPEAIRDLHAEGIRIVMLTGDSRSYCKSGCRANLDIDQVHAEVSPEQKAKWSSNCRLTVTSLPWQVMVLTMPRH